MWCRACGAPLPTGAINCPNCGSSTFYNTSASSYGPTLPISQAPPTTYDSPPPPPSRSDIDPSYPYGSMSSPYSSSPYEATNPPSQTPAPQTPRKNNTKMIIFSATVAFVLVLIAILGIFAVSTQHKNSGNSISAPTPAGERVDPTAAKIITNPKTASEIDKDTAQPKKLANTFKVGDTVYETFDLNLTGVVRVGANNIYGYAQARWYDGPTLLDTYKITVDQNYPGGYFSLPYNRAT